MIEKSVAKITVFPTSLIGLGPLLMVTTRCSELFIVLTS